MKNCLQFVNSSKVVKAGHSSRIARKPTVQPMMNFSQLIFRGESRLELKFYKNDL